MADSVYPSYRNKTAIGGVFYLYNLTHGRFSGVARRSLENVWCLCEDAGLGKVMLSTTNGERLAPEERGRRENKLATHWKPIINKGAVVHHFRRDASSTWEIIKEFFPAPSELGRISHPRTLISPLLDAQITIVKEQGNNTTSSLTLVDTILDDFRKTDIVIPCV